MTKITQKPAPKPSAPKNTAVVKAQVKAPPKTGLQKKDELSTGVGRRLRAATAKTLLPQARQLETAGIMRPVSAKDLAARLKEFEQQQKLSPPLAPPSPAAVAAKKTDDAFQTVADIDAKIKDLNLGGVIPNPLKLEELRELKAERAAAATAAAQALADQLAITPEADRAAVAEKYAPQLEKLAVQSLKNSPAEQSDFKEAVNAALALLPEAASRELGTRLTDAQVEVYTDQINEATDAITDADGQDETNQATLDAASDIADILEDAPPDLRARILEDSESELKKLGRHIVDLGDNATKQFTEDIARAASAVGASNVKLLVDPIAEVIGDGALLQTGDDADGGLFGLADDVNKHNSEAEFKDALFELADEGVPGGELLQAAFIDGLDRNGKSGLAAAIATGDDVPRNFTGSLASAPREIAGAALDKVEELANIIGDEIREQAADLLNVDEHIDQLDSEGDTFTLRLGGSVGFGVFQGGVAGELEVTRVADGYDLTLSAEASGGVFAALNLPGFGEAGAEANVTGTASATFHFDDKAGVKQAAETVAGIAAATVATLPLAGFGGFLTTATADDELSALRKAHSSTSFELELSAEAKAKLLDKAGLGFGGGVRAEASASITLVLDEGEPPRIEISQGVEIGGNLNVGAPIEVPGFGNIGGSLDAAAGLSLTTTIPFPDGLTVGDVFRNPVGTIDDLAKSALEDGTTELKGQIELSGGSALASSGLEIELSATAPTGAIVGAIGDVLSGDFIGGLETLSEETVLDLTVNSTAQIGFTLNGDNEDGEQQVGGSGLKVGVEFKDQVIDRTELLHLEGTPAEILARVGDVLETIGLGTVSVTASAAPIDRIEQREEEKRRAAVRRS